jgi:thiol:disulfide interchange protein DsbC
MTGAAAMKAILGLLVGATLLAAAGVRADEQAIRRVLAPKLGEARIVEVKKLGRAGLYEVVVRRPEGYAVVYTDESASVLFIGSLIDTRTDRDLTEERVRQLSKIDWNALPWKWALTTRRGDGRREISIFSDPNCPYCRRFEADLAKLDDITVHIFLYPVIRPESIRQTKAVWCSRDRVKAWNDLMLNGVEPTASPDCPTPIDELVALGRRLGARSTPTWFLRNGEKHSGALRMEDLVPLLDAAAATRPSGGRSRQ